MSRQNADVRVNPFTERPSTIEGSIVRRSRDDEDDDAFDKNRMTESYKEISLPSSMSAVAGCSSSTATAAPPPRPVELLACDKTAFPYNLDGTVSRDGDMTHFVAENLEFKIKLSSPVTKKDVGGLYLRHNSSNQSTSFASNSRQPFTAQQQQQQQQQQQPQIDSNVLNDIEIESQYLAASVDNLTENLCNLLHSISSITADNVEIHKNAVNKLTDSMDANIKSMYTIMAKTEEISKSMQPTEALSNRIREIKRLVNMLESNL